jgi:hypothetical protein
MKILSKYQLSSSNGLGVMMFRRSGGKQEKTVKKLKKREET